MIQPRRPTWSSRGWERDPRTGEYRHPDCGVVSKLAGQWLLEIPKANREDTKRSCSTHRRRADAMLQGERLRERAKKREAA